MSSDFVHLHLHTDYSLLDGACSVKGIIDMAKDYKMPAVAMTDHGFMGGTVDFYQKLNKEGIKPIIGCEMYLSPTTRFDKNPAVENIRGYHIVLLAKDIEGYRSLCKLTSGAYKDGYYYRPRIDKELLAQHSKGLVGLSACLQGEIDVAIRQGKLKESKHILGEYLDIFGRDDFYLEIMDHGMQEQKDVNKELILLSKEFNISTVATNDCHYLRKEHSRAHELLLCIQTRSTVNDPNRFTFSSDQFYFKSAEEMYNMDVFREHPEAVKNTLGVAEKCQLELAFGVNHYPVYNIDDTAYDNQRDYLHSICLEGIEERYNFNPRVPDLTEEQKGIVDRTEFELGIIERMGYPSYFLVVWDFLKYAREKGIPVGPGRGSGAGSIVAYLTHITNVEPLRFNLLFERFLNPDRVSPPDFDIDFCERRRCEVIEYVRDKYGHDSVAQIGTYGTLKAKAVLKDVARVLGYPPAMGDKITKLIPGSPNTLEEAKEDNRDLMELIQSDSDVQKIFENAAPLVGLNRNMSMHAAGVIIGDQELDNVVPLAHGANKELITQFSAVPCEQLGLLKMDFLGLKTLTIIQDAVDNIKLSKGIDIDISQLPLDDKKTYNLLNCGDTIAVFQLESPGMQNLCKQFGVETIEHIIALIAIYRPGPMEFIPDFVSRKMGKTKIEYDHPLMEQYLNETYGIMLYQEQIMQVVQVLAGFSLGQADILRRAIGKKKVKVLEEQKAKFVQGCAETNNISEQLADQIWAKIAMFAGYGFNKSHSAAYAFLAYQTAYLKANYPEEFMAAVLSSELSNADKIRFFITECSEMDIPVLSPDINSSHINFSVDGNSIRFGLGAIKGVGEAASESIIEARDKGGKFTDFNDFCERAGEATNSRMMENFIRAGAFDTIGLKRSQLVAIAEDSLKLASEKNKDKASGQGSLFDMLGAEEQSETLSIPIPDIPEFDDHEMLKDEKELLGFYVTGHPISAYADVIELYSSTNLREIASMPGDKGVKVGGIIKSYQRRISKNNGNPWGLFQLEDTEGTVDCMIYGKTFDQFQDLLYDEAPLFVEAVTRKRDENDSVSLAVRKIVPMSEVTKNYTKEIHIHIFEATNNMQDLEAIKNLCMSNPVNFDKNGNPLGSRLILCVKCSNGEIGFIESQKHVSVTESFLKEIQRLLGERKYKLKPDETVPQARPRFVPPPKSE